MQDDVKALIAELKGAAKEMRREGYQIAAGYHTKAAQALTDLSARVVELEAALKPFADCCEEIHRYEDDEEWAKFRLLVKDYRRARKALTP